MTGALGGFVDFLEDVIARTVSDVVELVQDGLALMGPRPFGFTRGSVDAQLAAYLHLRDDPAAWSGFIQQQTPFMGLAAAIVTAIREATRLEGLLDSHGGANAVRFALLLRAQGPALRAVNQAERAMQQPVAIVRPPLPLDADPWAQLLGVPAGVDPLTQLGMAAPLVGAAAPAPQASSIFDSPAMDQEGYLNQGFRGIFAPTADVRMDTYGNEGAPMRGGWQDYQQTGRNAA